MSDSKIVNVASVPQLSPFRFPGGKTWLVPEIRGWLRSLPVKPKILIEPFAGGGIASLTAIFENLVNKVVLVELDEHIAAVWQVILEEANWLAERIINFNITLQNVKEALSQPPINLKEKAFQTILRNRVQRGGILAPGASLMKSGENRRGISSRWYPVTLAKRIQAIYLHRKRITFINGDAFDIIPRFLENKMSAFFIDPPYTAGGKRAGRRLYTYNEVDHQKLFSLMSMAKGNFLMTYDESSEVAELANRFDFQIHRVLMKSTHHRKQYELLVSPQPILDKLTSNSLLKFA